MTRRLPGQSGLASGRADPSRITHRLLQRNRPIEDIQQFEPFHQHRKEGSVRPEGLNLVVLELIANPNFMDRFAHFPFLKNVLHECELLERAEKGLRLEMPDAQQLRILLKSLFE